MLLRFVVDDDGEEEQRHFLLEDASCVSAPVVLKAQKVQMILVTRLEHFSRLDDHEIDQTV